jgi:hypothetical protein
MGSRLKNYTVNVPKMLVQALVVGFCLTNRASAQVSYTIANAPSSSTGSGYADLEEVNISIDGSTINNAFAGGIVISESGMPVAGLPAEYTTVCTDVNATLYLGDTYKFSTPASFLNPTTLTGIDPSWGAVNTPGNVTVHGINSANATQGIENAAYLFYNYSGGLSVNTGIGGSATQMAALQLAVWEALYDTTTSGQVVLGSGSRFQALAGGDQTVVADATALINGLDSLAQAGNFGYTGDLLVPNPATPNNGSPYLNANYDNEPPQELLYGIAKPQGNTAVPETSTVLAAALLLLPLGASTLRILRKNSAA